MHRYSAHVTWTGDRGTGTSSYRAYDRDHDVTAPGKPPILGSADPAYRGDPARWNPEELLVAALAQCHMLWFLHLAAAAGVVVTGYVDDPEGMMRENPDGSGEFTQVVLRPAVRTAPGHEDVDLAALHHRAHAACFIARSVAFEVLVEPAAS